MSRNLIGIRAVEWVMGQRRFAWACTAMAKMGLRGLGVNVHYDLDRSGELVFLNAFLRAYPKSVCFDVGANVGDYSEALVNRSASVVVAFEPTPATFSRLKQRLGANPSVRLANLAVGESPGEIQFDVPRRESDSVLASRDISITDIAGQAYDKILVEMTSLDAYVDQAGSPPDFVKIDVEGYELEVLLGMGNLLSERPPKAIQFEFNGHLLKRRQSLPDFAAILPGYSFFRLASNSMRPLDPGHYLSNIYCYSNIVAVHKSCVAVLSEALC